MRLAIVTPWFGRALIGGAERHAWELAHALAAAGANVDVLTTCCRSFHDDWATNFHRAGTTVLAERLRVRRFRVDSRDRVAYGRVTATLTSLPALTLRGDAVPLDPRDARIFVTESINSRALHAALIASADDYDAIIFMPYLYGTTLAMLPSVAEKAFLIPCLHDEAYAYLDPVRDCFAKARGLLFNSIGEEETAAAIYGPGIYGKSRVIGEAVEPVLPPRTPMRIGSFTPNRSRYVVYLGRQVATKNIDFLIAAYKLFRERKSATSLQLVLAGPTNVSRSEDGIIDLGPVAEEAKASLLTYARALAQPSTHESFSRAVYESWFARRPVFVHGDCRATTRAVEESGGGWIGSTLDAWARMFAELDESADDAIDAVGNRGWAAALENGSWDVVAQRVCAAIERRSSDAVPRIDQTVPLGDRDAARFAGALHEALIASGCSSEIVVTESGSLRGDAAQIAHVRGADVPIDADAYIAHDGEPDFPNRQRPVFAVSPAVAARLDDRGIASKLLAAPVSPAAWDGIRIAHRRWLDGRPVILSLSPLAASDVRRVIDVFVAFLGRSRRARLLIFAADCSAEAMQTLRHDVAELDLADDVELVPESRAERYTAFRSATVAIAHGRVTHIENLATAQWFGVPVVGSGDAVFDGVEAFGIVETEANAQRCAALLRLVTGDRALADAMAIEGRRAVRRHDPATVVTAVIEALAAPGLRGERSADLRGIDAPRP